MAQPRDRKGRFASTGGGAVLLAGVIALAAAAGPGGGLSFGSGGSSGASRSGSSNVAKARDRDPAPVLRRLVDRGLDVEQSAVAADDDCAEHAYGAVSRS